MSTRAPGVLIAIIVAIALVASGCSSSSQPRTLQEPSQTTTTRDPSLARSAGAPLDTTPTDPGAAGDDPTPPANDDPVAASNDAASVVHVVGSIRSVPTEASGWQEFVPIMDNDLATVASLSCDRGDQCDPTAITEWAAGRVEVVNVATSANVLDRDDLALVQASLARSGVRAVGYGVNAREATTPVIVENNTLGIAIHAVSLSAASEVVATDTSPGIAGPQLLDQVLAAVEVSREDGYGIVVLVDSGGLDARAPTDAAIAAVEQLIESGADAVVGHGSDFLQRFDQVGSAAVVYGLGNAVTTSTDPLRSDTAVLRLEFGTPGRSCLVPATASPDGPTQDDGAIADCSTR